MTSDRVCVQQGADRLRAAGVEISAEAGGLRRVAAGGTHCLTAYDDAVIEAIWEAKGTAWLCDEILRDEDPSYIRSHIVLTITAHVAPEQLRGKRMLEFGSGCGASTIALKKSRAS